MGAEDGGFLGWKNWKIPTTSRFEARTKPDEKIDGSYAGDALLADHPYRTFPGELFNPVQYPNLSPAWTLQSQFVAPQIKTIFTDMTGIYNGAGMQCEGFELQAMECMEYYGTNQGFTACKDVYDDLMECKYKTKRRLRTKHMYKKRGMDNHLEYLQGKRTWEQTYEPPPKFHAYMSPFQDPTKASRPQGGGMS